MGQVRHGNATTTHAVRAAIQRSQAALARLSKKLKVNLIPGLAERREQGLVQKLSTKPFCMGLPGSILSACFR